MASSHTNSYSSLCSAACAQPHPRAPLECGRQPDVSQSRWAEVFADAANLGRYCLYFASKNRGVDCFAPIPLSRAGS